MRQSIIWARQSCGEWSSPGWALSHPLATTRRRCWPVCTRRSPAFRIPTNSPSTGFAVRSLARRSFDVRERDRSPRDALSRRGCSLESCRDGAGDPRQRCRAERHIQRAHRHHHGIGRSVHHVIVEAADITREKGSPKRIGPFAVPKAMSSTASATLATWFKIKGVNYSISSACATSNHCIGNAAEIIQWGKQDMIFAGGCEELHWTLVQPVRRHGRDVLEIQRYARRPHRAPMTPIATAS